MTGSRLTAPIFRKWTSKQIITASLTALLGLGAASIALSSLFDFISARFGVGTEATASSRVRKAEIVNTGADFKTKFIGTAEPIGDVLRISYQQELKNIVGHSRVEQTIYFNLSTGSAEGTIVQDGKVRSYTTQHVYRFDKAPNGKDQLHVDWIDANGTLLQKDFFVITY
jgi:hypothetical protein